MPPVPIQLLPEKGTFSVDYLGTLRTSGYSDQITNVRFLNPDSFGGSMFIMMYDAADSFHISFNQTFDSDRYYQAFLKILGELGIAYEKGEPGAYLNPEVEMPAEQR